MKTYNIFAKKMYFSIYKGEIFAILTSVCWTISALIYERVGRKFGVISMNFLRLLMAFVFISLYLFIAGDGLLLFDINTNAWLYLALSGFLGFVFGDICLFKSFSFIGARLAMLIMSLSPLIAASMGWLILDETMSLWQLFAMFITITGIAIVIFARKKNTNEKKYLKNKKISVNIIGIILALCGAIGQSAGLVVSKKGLGNYDVFAATQIRIIAAIIAYFIIVSSLKLWKNLFMQIKDIKTISTLSIGAFAGSFVGVVLSLLAIKNTNTGIASTLTSLAPIFIILPSFFINKEKISIIEIVGTCIAIFGISLFFI